MDINNLKEGMIIKNYKELCKILNIKYDRKRKKRTLEELREHYNIEENGNKIIIKKLKNINDNEIILKFRNGKYIKYLANIILIKLYNEPDKFKQIPLMQLFAESGITNINYNDSNSYRKELSQLYNINLNSIYYFYNNTKNEYKKIIERCLDNLRNRRVLEWSRCIMIIDKDKRIYKADEKEVELILDTEKEALKYMDLFSMNEVIQQKRLKEFKNIVSKELTFDYYYAYDIKVGKIAVKIEYENIKNEMEELNNLIIHKNKILFDKPKYYAFLNDYKKLNEILIDTKNNNMILNELKTQREKNKLNYKNDLIEENIRHYEKQEELKDTYFDKNR